MRAERSDRVVEVQPREVQPLVSELNSLLEQNALNLDRARRHVADLAHGLKTPLATLAVALPKDEHGTEIHELVELMERHIRHHLGRARTAALNGPTRAHTMVAPHVTDLGAVLGKVHADKHVDFSVDIAGDLAVACEEQDFDEMAGNLLDNAFQWTRRKVDVCAGVKGGNSVVLSIEDDGPGFDLEQAPQVANRVSGSTSVHRDLDSDYRSPASLPNFMADRSNSRNRLRVECESGDVAESTEWGGIDGTCFSSNPLLRLALVKLKTLTGAASIGFDVLLATAPIPIAL